jgi:uncharacterized membrane protein
MKIALTVMLALLTALYPVAVYFSLDHLSPRFWGGILLGLFALRLWMQRRQTNSHVAQWSMLAAVIAALWMLVGDSTLAMRSYPVMINVTLACVFGWSLLNPPTLIERLARLQEPELPPSGVAYTRKVTQVWLIFFLINGSIAAYTAYLGSHEQWALYNGVISYILMGCLFGGEWIVRQFARKREPS